MLTLTVADTSGRQKKLPGFLTCGTASWQVGFLFCFIFLTSYFMCTSVLLACMYAYQMLHTCSAYRGLKTASEFLALELQKVDSHHVGAGDWTRGLLNSPSVLNSWATFPAPSRFFVVVLLFVLSTASVSRKAKHHKDWLILSFVQFQSNFVWMCSCQVTGSC